MYSEESIDSNRKLLKHWDEQTKKRYGNQEFNATTASGIPLKPFYSPQDIKDLNWDEIGVPGEYPYTRGNFPLEYQFKSWDNAQPQG
ncbi:MAG: methylmalonyl-CoA mutase family protein, partial [Dehalococcoidia bacterium]|nr:methylmalonyl-CoA mutase family protein [Dehalococcoidia bacterium]